jgi:hypothetical protein
MNIMPLEVIPTLYFSISYNVGSGVEVAYGDNEMLD